MNSETPVLRQTDLGSVQAKGLRAWARDGGSGHGTRAWPALLVKEAALDVHLPARPLHIYEMVQWYAPPSDGPAEVGTSREWVSWSPRFVETALCTTVRRGDQELARALMVFREAPNDSQGASFGQRRLPDPPETSEMLHLGQIVVTEGEVEEFAELVGGIHPLHSSASDAQHRGFPNLLVQGHVLIQLLLRSVQLGPRQIVEAWFLRPVPVGAVLTLRSSAGQEQIRSLTQVGRDDPSVLLRVTAA